MTDDPTNVFLEPVDDGLPMRAGGDWANEKLHFLKNYIERFIVSMRNMPWRSIHYIDLFSGPGKNKTENKGIISLGSPLIVLNQKRDFDKYFFCDIEQDNINTLSKRCSLCKQYPKIEFFSEDANKAVHSVVKKIVNIDTKFIKGVWPSLNLAFLDPEGLELRWDTVNVLASMKRMDLIIYYPQMGITRQAPNELGLASDTAIDSFFGDRQWRTIYEEFRDSSSLHRKLLDYYKSKLANLGYTNFQTNEPVAKNSKGAPLYRLLFASKHPLGDKFWEDTTSTDVYGQKSLF